MMQLPNHIRTLYNAYRMGIFKSAIKQCWQIGLDESDKIAIIFAVVIAVLFTAIAYKREIDGDLAQVQAELKITRHERHKLELFAIGCLNSGYVKFDGVKRPCAVSASALRG